MPAKKTTKAKTQAMTKEGLANALAAQNVAVIELEDTLIECRLKVELENGKAVLNMKPYDVDTLLAETDPVAKVLEELSA